MNKKVLKIIIFNILLIVFSVLNVKAIDETNYYYLNNSTGYVAVIEDDANLLTDKEKELLFNQIKDLTKFGHIEFKSVNSNSLTTESYIRNYYYNNFSQESGTIFFIDMDNRQIYIFSNGDNYNIITSQKAYSITDNIYKYASKGQYYECAKKAFIQVESLLNNQKISEPMKIICNIIISVVIAFFVGFFIVFFKYRIKKATTDQMIKNAVVDFKVNDVQAIFIGSHREYSPVSSDSGSSGSSGGGGGGGSSGGGGGGGHSF